MSRYSCAFSGICEASPNGKYASLDECLLNCDSIEDKDINYLILQYAPNGLRDLAPTDQIEMIKRLTGIVVLDVEASTIIEALGDLDWIVLATTGIRDWVAEELDIPVTILYDVLVARETGSWSQLRGVPEAIPFFREDNQAVVFFSATPADWDTMTSQELYQYVVNNGDNEMLRGDVVEFAEISDTAVYNGVNELLKLVDGRLPIEILINDFPTTTYFKTAMIGNYLIWLDPTEFVLQEEEEHVDGTWNMKRLVAVNEQGDRIYIYTDDVSALFRIAWNRGEVIPFYSNGYHLGFDDRGIEAPELSVFYSTPSNDDGGYDGDGDWEPTDEEIRRIREDSDDENYYY